MSERKFTEEELEQGWFEDDSECIMCSACGEWSSETIAIDVSESGPEEAESMGSSCCGAPEPYYD